ncbi:MAG: hypothetical protein N3E40_05430, partial [Dehalococcoidia bacterium]|nr:hypothetical protein [Dehalococcoidia bacterium]
LRFSESNAELKISLIERETNEATDSVSTYLITPNAGGGGAVLPPGWGGGTAVSWNSMLNMMMPLVIVFMMGTMLGFALKSSSTKGLPPGRRE